MGFLGKKERNKDRNKKYTFRTKTNIPTVHNNAGVRFNVMLEPIAQFGTQFGSTLFLLSTPPTNNYKWIKQTISKSTSLLLKRLMARAIRLFSNWQLRLLLRLLLWVCCASSTCWWSHSCSRNRQFRHSLRQQKDTDNDLIRNLQVLVLSHTLIYFNLGQNARDELHKAVEYKNIAKQNNQALFSLQGTDYSIINDMAFWLLTSFCIVIFFFAKELFLLTSFMKLGQGMHLYCPQIVHKLQIF